MGDFLLDFRSREVRRRSAAQASKLLTFCEDTQVRMCETEQFSLVLTRVDGFDVWGPCEFGSQDGDLFVALAGRIALDELEWERAHAAGGVGGLACRGILQKYLTGGVKGLGSLNGNFVAFVHDARSRQFHIITDRCGMFLAYYCEPLAAARVFASHPDVLAAVLGEDQRLDHVSMAEFLTTGRVTFPNTYYQNLRGLETGCIHTVSMGDDSRNTKSRYFEFNFRVDSGDSETELAHGLAHAFQNAVRRRTLPLFGRTAVGLSGGLDSRAILSSVARGTPVRAFTLFDAENTEFRTARALAAAAHVDFIPLRRDFEYYANSAELGVRICGGTGNIASNHFLGVRHQLAEHGIRNLLTGCYCDYLFKGLALNTSERRFSRTQRLSGFDFSFYHRYRWDRTRHHSAIKDRLHALFPESSWKTLSEEDWLNIERKRSFPLAYEGDLAQRVIPQRVLPWFVPIADSDLIDIYLRIPPRYKLNAALFKQTVLLVCDEALRRVADSNTGAPLSASRLRYSVHRYLSALQNRISAKAIPRMATRGSWPNWEYYLRHSRIIPLLWRRKNQLATELFSQLLGDDPLQKLPCDFAGHDAEYFLRLFTLKLWFDQRLGNPPQASCVVNETAALNL